MDMTAALNIAQAALVGHSFGSLICLQAAADLGPRATHLALVGTAYPMQVSQALLDASRDEPMKALHMTNVFSRATLSPPSGAGSWVFGASLALGRRVLASNPSVNLFHTGFQACNLYDKGFEAMAAVSCPVRMVLGEADQMTTPKAARCARVRYATPGVGSSGHLAGEQFKALAGIDIVHVPYRGTGPAHTDLIGGRVTMFFAAMAGTLPYVNAGRLRALGVTTVKRWPGAPQIPTMVEAGLAGFEVNSWYGLIAPTGTPREIVTRLNTEVANALREPDARARLYSIGAEPMSNTPEEFGIFIQNEMAKWAKVVKVAGIKVE